MIHQNRTKPKALPAKSLRSSIRPRPPKANISILPCSFLRSLVFLSWRLFFLTQKTAWEEREKCEPLPVKSSAPAPTAGPVITPLLWAEIAFCLSGQYGWTGGVGEGCLFANKWFFFLLLSPLFFFLAWILSSRGPCGWLPC